MSYFDHAYDIFILDDLKYSEYFDSKITNAVIPISYKKALINSMPVGKNYFYCNKCSFPTYYLWAKDNIYLCPSCVKDVSLCNKCYFPIGCNSCSGISESMVNVSYENTTIILCYNDKCLMPFGYQTNKEIKCSCDIDNFDLLLKKIPKDIVCHNIKHYMFSKFHNMKRESYVLGDLTESDCNKCLKCQLLDEYITVNIQDVCHNYKEQPVCKCYDKLK